MTARPRSGSTALLLVGIAMSLPFPLSAQDPGLQADRWNRAAIDWVTLLRTGDFEAAGSRVDPAVPEGAMSPSQLETIWAQLSAQLGNLVSLDPGSVEPFQTYQRANLQAVFDNAEVVLRVVLNPDLQISGFFVLPPKPPAYEVPAYVDEESFTEAEVTVGSDPWALPGVLTLPRGGGPFPGVVLVHGSGPNDRDETVGGNRPFRDLAWGLASRGIAVLRYDKRTRVHGSALPADLGLEAEVVEDALLALDLLRGREEVDEDRVFLLGHSLGAMLAPDIGLRDGRVAGVSVLAAPLRPFLEVLRSQLEYIGSLENDPSSPARIQLDSLLAEVGRAESGEMGPEETLLGVRRAYWAEVERLEPLEAARRLSAPIFILQGGRDYQSTTEDFRLWEQGLAGKGGVRMKLYPSLSHLFTPGEGTATPEEYSTQVKHVDEEVIRDLSDWILGGE
ncbi:MAG: alpha/beta hydrolase [Longimicrobiales bacterium]